MARSRQARPHAEIRGPAHITCVLDPAGLDDGRDCLKYVADLLLKLVFTSATAGRSHN